MALPRSSAWKGLLEILVQSRAEDALSILLSNLEHLQHGDSQPAWIPIGVFDHRNC